MASRLSEYALKEVYDSGLKGLAWTLRSKSASMRPGGVPSLRELLESPEPTGAVHAVEPLDLYRAIKTQGIEDHLELLPLISEDQHIRMLDYEAWEGAELVPEKAFSWLNLFREVSHEEFFGRFKILDEEYQLSLLSRYIQVVDKEEYEKLDSASQDLYTPLPCNELFYRVETESSQVKEFIDRLIQAGLMVDLPYTYSLINHSAFMPPNEDTQKITQFRRARLEEDGFVDPSDARPIFVPLTGVEVDQIRGRYAAHVVDEASLPARVENEGLLLDRALELIVNADVLAQRLAHTVNTVAAAAGVSPDELQTLDQVVLLVKSVLSLGLDELAQGRAELAAEILTKEHPTQILRYGFALAQSARLDVAERLADSGMQGMDAVPRLVRLGRLGEVMLRIEQYLLPVLGLDSVEHLKGIFNRFPMGERKASSESGAGKLTFEPIHTIAGLNAASVEIEGILEEILSMREKMLADGVEDGEFADERVGIITVQ